MRKVLLTAGFTLVLASAAFAQVYVPGHVTRDGSYVQPHYRSAPDSSYNNNWSVQGNTNPYTGRSGTLSPTYNDRPPSSSYDSFGSGRLGEFGVGYAGDAEANGDNCRNSFVISSIGYVGQRGTELH
jgi:hypothetical protein